MDAAVRVQDRAVPVAFPAAGAKQAAVGELGARAGAHRPGDELAVEAVEDWREVALAARKAELGDVGEPEHVGGVGVEVPLDEVGRSIRCLSRVRAVFPCLLEVDDPAALFCHQPSHDLLGDDHGVCPGPQDMRDVAVSLARSASSKASTIRRLVSAYLSSRASALRWCS